MRKPVLVLTALLLSACMLLAACGERGAASSAAPSSASPQSEAAQSASPETGESDVSAPESLPENANDPETGEGTSLVIPIETDSPEFDAKFRDNPLDAAYVKESADAVSTLDMVALSEKYAALWEAEIEAGMEKLLSLATDDREVYQKEQEDWETGKDAALKALTEQAGEGSLAQLEAAGNRMDFFRTRANAVLRELYSYDPDFTYAYGSEEPAVSAAG